MTPGSRLQRRTPLRRPPGPASAFSRLGYYRRSQDPRTALQRTVGGFKYDSKAEASYAAHLELRVKARNIKGFKRQVWLPLVVNGRTICRYVVDFMVEHLDGSLEVIEVKGFATEVWALKDKLFRATWLVEHPEVAYTVKWV